MRFQIFLILLFFSFSEAVTTRWNPEFTCIGCVLITTDESLQGTIDISTSASTGTTSTFTTSTPSTTVTTTTTTPITTLTSTTPQTSNQPGTPPPVPVITTSETPITSSSSAITTITTIAPITIPNDSKSNGLITYTTTIGSTFTTTYYISKTTVDVIFVTYTTNYESVETIITSMTSTVVESSLVTYPIATSTIITPQSTQFDGYSNDSIVYDTSTTTILTALNQLRTSYELHLSTYYKRNIIEGIIISTFLNWGTDISTELVVNTSNYYQTLISTVMLTTSTSSTAQPVIVVVPVTPTIITTTTVPLTASTIPTSYITVTSLLIPICPATEELYNVLTSENAKSSYFLQTASVNFGSKQTNNYMNGTLKLLISIFIVLFSVFIL